MRSYAKYAALLLMILPSVWLVRLLFLRPFNIDHFFDRTYLLYALDKPELLSSMRVLDQYGIVSHRGHLDDASVQALDRQQRFYPKTAATLQGYDRSSLSEPQALSYDIF